MSEGAVWLHRKLLDSAVWSSSDATRCGFITCLLLANFKDQQWYSRAEHRQIVIARGSFFTTWEKFISLSNLSKQQTRDCFKTLEDLNIITRRPTQRGTFITILNFDTYQKVGTYRGTQRATDKEPMRNPIGTQLEEGKEGKERKEGESLSFFVEKWQRREDRKEYAADIAMGLKTFKLSFRVEEDMYTKIMGEGDNGTVRSKSISEQVAERRRAQGLEKLRNESSPGKIFDSIRNLPKVQPET